MEKKKFEEIKKILFKKKWFCTISKWSDDGVSFDIVAYPPEYRDGKRKIFVKQFERWIVTERDGSKREVLEVKLLGSFDYKEGCDSELKDFLSQFGMK